MIDFLNVNFRETIPVNFIELFREIIDENVTLDPEKEALINREISLLHCLRNHASFKLDTKNAEDIAGYCNQVNLLLDNFEKLPFDSSIRTKWFNAFSRDDKEEAICVEFVGIRAELVNSLFNYGLALAQEASIMYRDVIPEETNYETISTLFLKAAGVYEYIIELKNARKTNDGYNHSADLSSDMLSLIFILMLAEAQSAKYEHMKLKLNNRQSAIILNKSIDYFDIVKKKTLLPTIQPYIQLQWQNAIEIKILRLNSLLCYHSGMDLFLIGNKEGAEELIKMALDKMLIFKENNSLHLVKQDLLLIQQSYADISSPTFEDSSMSYIKKLNENELTFLALFNEIAGYKEELMVNLKLTYDALDHMTPFCDTVSDKCKEVYMDFEELNQRVQTYDTKLFAYLKETRRKRMENRATIIVPNTLFNEDDDSSSTRTLTQTDLDRAVDPEEFSDDDMSIIHEDEIKSLKEQLTEQNALGINESTNYSEKIKKMFNL
uniref:BRO1 domain-containing protein n=1 Tax=Rhabditophanes sp. KR3021 TaxID=114890 RepID=A0AC35UCI5_9BILA